MMNLKACCNGLIGLSALFLDVAPSKLRQQFLLQGLGDIQNALHKIR
jgi:hypothetical protein